LCLCGEILNTAGEAGGTDDAEVITFG
jgi:hypothetical protein